MRRSGGSSLAALAFVALLLSACGSNTEVATTRATSPSSRVTSTSIATPADRALKAKLLTLDDLQGFYEPLSGSRVQDETPGCLQALRPAPGVARAEAAWADNAGGSLVEVLSVPMPTAAAAFTKLTGALSRCSTFSLQYQGKQVQGTVAPLVYPTPAERSAAYRFTIRLGGHTLYNTSLLIQQGNTLMLLNYNEVDSSRLDAFELIVATALGKDK